MEKVKDKVLYSFLEQNAREAADLHRLCFEDMWSEKFFKDLLKNPYVQGFVIKEPQDKALKGLILGQLCGDSAEIYTLAVHPENRREKLGTYLIESFFVQCLGQSIEEIFIEVNENNLSALSFYQNLGFRSYGLRQKYYILSNNDYANAILLRLKINKK